MRATLLLAALSVALAGPAACTFPTVDYAVDGGTEAGPACSVPKTCASDAMSCASSEGNKHTACTNSCHNDAACIANCDGTQKTELSTCAAKCESCAASACGGAATDCGALVGL